MLRYVYILVLILVGTPVLAQTARPMEPPQPATAQASRQDDVAAMQADLKNMRSILDQMKENLVLVSNTTTPLYHQLRLDVDMWQALLDHMDRHMAEMKNKK